MITAPLLLLIIAALAHSSPRKDTSKRRRGQLTAFECSHDYRNWFDPSFYSATDAFCTSDTYTVKNQLLDDLKYEDVVYMSWYAPGDVVLAFCDDGPDGHRLKCEGSGWKHENGSTNVGCLDANKSRK